MSEPAAWFPAIVALIAVVVISSVVRHWLLRPGEVQDPESRLPRQLALFAFNAIGALIILLSLPMAVATRGQLLSFFGVLVTAVIALSSTTFVTNAMAGLMLRMVNSFRPGDYIHINGQFGRVTERGLFHTEMQTEDRDLTTLPNLQLVTQPVTVVHSDGTVISATLSLGYDIPTDRVEKYLLAAAEKSGLSDAFVLVLELNDYSVSYRAAGFLSDVNNLLTARSRLRREILAELHGAGIEIVSPAFMNQRPIKAGTKVIPARSSDAGAGNEVPQDKLFDKGEEASSLQALKDELDALKERRKALDDEKKSAGKDKTTAEKIRGELSSIDQRLAELVELLGDAKSESKTKSKPEPKPEA